MDGQMQVMPVTGPDQTIEDAPGIWSAERRDRTPVDSEEALLLRVLAVLDRAGVPYWVIDGYGEASFDPCDVDCVVPADVLPRRLAQVLHADADRIGADIVKWREDHHVVLASRGCDAEGKPHFLNMHFRPDFRRVGRYFYSGAELLAGRQQSGDGAPEAWVPATAVEFGCYLIEKIAKQCLDAAKGRKLEEAYRQDPTGCEKQVRRFWGADSAELIIAAVRSGNWTSVQAELPRLRGELRRRAALRRPLWTAAYFLRKVWLKGVRTRWRPGSGMHVVLLGPDGVGKTTIQNALRSNSRWSFSEVRGRSFAPPPWRKPRTLGQPHGKPPRSLPASLLKAAYWLVYYTIGYYFTVYPAVSRSALYLNHRYIVDTLVDCKRYRYGGPRWILRLIWWLAPKPDLVILLDAPADVVQGRKQEVPLEETARACAAYRALVGALTNGRIVDANQPVEQVVAEVVRTILRLRMKRTARQLGLE